jgi:hypothetical protein
MDVAARRELNNGFGNTLSRSFEFAVTPTIFAALGYGVDRWLDTSVVFTIVLLLIAIAGMSIRWYYDYQHSISLIEDAKADQRKATRLAAPVITKPLSDAGGLATGVTLDSGTRQS